MRLLILTGLELQAHPTLKTSIHRLRHKVFVENLGWEALRRSDSLEIDAFDTDQAVHFVVLASSNRIEAYSRIIPTTQPHLLSHVYPHLLQGGALPVGQHIWEWTRGIGVPVPTTPPNAEHEISNFGISLSPAGRMMIVGNMEWAWENGVEMLSVQCEPGYEKVMQNLGVKARVLAGKSATSEGQDVVPIVIYVQKDTGRKLRRVFGMGEEVERARL